MRGRVDAVGGPPAGPSRRPRGRPGVPGDARSLKKLGRGPRGRRGAPTLDHGIIPIRAFGVRDGTARQVFVRDELSQGGHCFSRRWGMPSKIRQAHVHFLQQSSRIGIANPGRPGKEHRALASVSRPCSEIGLACRMGHGGLPISSGEVTGCLQRTRVSNGSPRRHERPAMLCFLWDLLAFLVAKTPHGACRRAVREGMIDHSSTRCA